MSMQELITYDVNEAAIAEMSEKYLSLRVANFNDKASYELCHKARMEVRGIRVAVEKRRKELKAESLEFGRKVDAKAKELTESLTKIETHLREQQDVIDKELERRKAEAERLAQEKLSKRIAALNAVRAPINPAEIAEMTDDGFALVLAARRAEFEQAEAERKAEQERIAALEAERAAEREKQAAIEAENRRLREEIEAQKRAALAAEEKRLADERAKIEAENRRIAAEKAEAERVERERAAAENARIEAERVAKAKAEAEAAKKVRDKKIFDEIKAEFPTVEAAWVEIARLRKALAGER